MPPIRSALARILRERGSLLVACMLLAIGGVMTLAWWDSLRESDAVFRDVGDEQSVLASVVAVDLRAHLSALERHAMAPGKEPKDAGSGLVVHLLTSDGHPVSMGVRAADLLGTLSNRPGELRVLLAPPGERGFYTADDQRLDLTAVRDGTGRAHRDGRDRARRRG
jgi:hypothetical protein